MTYNEEGKRIVNTLELNNTIHDQLKKVKNINGEITLDLSNLEIINIFNYNTDVEKILKDKGAIKKGVKININFTNTEFKNAAIFKEANISGEVNFLGVTFSRSASFYETTFLRDTSFIHAIFLTNATFENTTFSKNVDFWGATFERESNFRRCKFLERTRFTNTRFENTTNFLRAEFEEDALFYHTYFKGVTIFSQATFKGRALFIYSVISNVLVLQGVTFEQNKGLDLASATITGTINPFGFGLQEYSTSNKTSLTGYYDEINNKFDRINDKKETIGAIPTRIKRETFRILKEACEKQSNIVEALEFKKLEKEALNEELGDLPLVKPIKWLTSKFSNFSWIKSWTKFLNDFWDKAILGLNKWSNNHGTSPGRAFLFTAGVGLVFFNLSLLCISKLDYTFCLDISICDKSICDMSFCDIEIIINGLKDFLNFMNPTHGFDYIGDEVKLTTGFYIWDSIGRVFVGYGIYQFVQAFRKFR